jgi:hypothetical protein
VSLGEREDDLVTDIGKRHGRKSFWLRELAPKR